MIEFAWLKSAILKTFFELISFYIWMGDPWYNYTTVALCSYSSFWFLKSLLKVIYQKMTMQQIPYQFFVRKYYRKEVNQVKIVLGVARLILVFIFNSKMNDVQALILLGIEYKTFLIDALLFYLLIPFSRNIWYSTHSLCK